MPRVTSGSSIPNAPVARSSAAIAKHVLVDPLALRVDMGVGGDDEHDVLGRPVEGRRREGDRGGRVATHRLEQQGGVGHLVADDPLVAAVGDDRDVVGQAAQPPLGGLEQGFVAEQREEGLRALGPAQRMESGPATAGHDDGVHVVPILAPRRTARIRPSLGDDDPLPFPDDLALPLVVAGEVHLELATWSGSAYGHLSAVEPSGPLT